MNFHWAYLSSPFYLMRPHILIGYCLYPRPFCWFIGIYIRKGRRRWGKLLHHLMARLGESSADSNSRTLNIVILTRAVWIDNMLRAPALTSDIQLSIADWMVLSPQTHKLSFLTMPHSPYPLTGRLAMHTIHFILMNLWNMVPDGSGIKPLTKGTLQSDHCIYVWVQVKSNQLKLHKFSKLVFFFRIFA